MFHILAETGMRGGELCGLFRADVDLDARTIRIGRSAYQGHLQTTKTENADRVIYISSFLAERIKQYTDSVQSLAVSAGRSPATLVKSSRGVSPQHGQSDLLFPLPGKLAWDNSDIVLDGLKPIVRAMGIDEERMGLHAFRHASKSLMLHLGVPEKYRSERQGHSTGGGKMDMIYAHTDLEHHRMYAEIIGRALLVTRKPVTSSPVVARSAYSDMGDSSSDTPKYDRHQQEFTRAFRKWKFRTGHKGNFYESMLSVEERAEVESMMPRAEREKTFSAGAD